MIFREWVKNEYQATNFTQRSDKYMHGNLRNIKYVWEMGPIGGFEP